MQLPQLKRIRWAVRAALILGVAASVAANILHARPNPISQAISAWPPLALLLTVELTSRIPMHKRGLAALRVSATGVIAGIAAWVSYWHMQDVAVRYGETTMSAYLLPVSVDGLIVVASVSLVELAGRLRLLEDNRMAATAQPVPPVQFVAPAPAAPVFRPATARPDGDGDRTRAEAIESGSAAPVSPAVAPRGDLPLSAVVAASTRPAYPYVNGATPNGSSPRPNTTRAAVSTPARTVVTAATSLDDEDAPGAPRQRRPVAETAELADAIEALNPDISQEELAKQLGVSVNRLRAIRREARDTRRAAAASRLAGATAG